MRAAILALTQHRQTRRQITRALQANGSTVSFVMKAEEAKQAWARQTPHLVIIDCDSEEGHSALQVLQQERSASGTTPIVLLSLGFDKRPLVAALESEEIRNVVAKHGPARALYPVFDERELSVTCEKLIQQNIFGVDKYVGGWGVVVNSAVIRSLDDKADFVDLFQAYLESLDCPPSVLPEMLTAAEELILNAMVHAPRTKDGAPRYESSELDPHLVLEPHEAVTVVYACDGQRLMLSVVDNFGSMTQEALRQYLFSRLTSTQLVIDEKPSGAGIGLAMALRGVHQLVVNVETHKRTEVIIGWYLRVTNSSEFREVGKSINVFWLQQPSH